MTNDKNDASLLVHLATDNTSIFPPTSRAPASRGGSYGVGTGFDADDAGEENEEEELYEEHTEQWSSVDGQERDEAHDHQKAPRIGTADLIDTEVHSVAAAATDWRTDSLLRRILQRTDVWIETRGLRSGKARDCHGEVCIVGQKYRALSGADPRLPFNTNRFACTAWSVRASRVTWLYRTCHCQAMSSWPFGPPIDPRSR